MKKFTNTALNNLFFAFNHYNVSQVNTENEKVNLLDITNILTGSTIPAEYNEISRITIEGFNNNIEEKEIKKIITPLKSNLNYFLFSGYQQRGHNNANIEYNGCIQIDIDIKRKGGNTIAKKIKEELQKLPYIILAGISPSGMGVKALVATDNLDINKHTSVANSIFSKIRYDLGISESEKWFDSLGASQPCYVFYDKDLYVNYDAEIFIVDWNSINQPKQTKVRKEVSKGTFSLKETDKITKALNIAYNYANKKCDGFNTTFLQKYVPFVSSFGVDADYAYEFLIQMGHEEDMNSKRTNSFFDMYQRFENSFGTIDIDTEEIEDSPKMTYILEKGQKVYDLNITLSESCILQSPTGSGKTYWVAQQTGKKIIVVPTQALVKQCASDYGFSEYYEDKKEISDSIAVTYNSFDSLCSVINLSLYDVYVDESHNFTSSASESFQLNNLRNVLKRLKYAKKYILLTATPLYNYSDIINTLDIIKIERVENIEKNLIKVNYEDRLSAIEKLVHDSKANNRFAAILLNNTKEEGELGRIKTLLSDYKQIIINSNNKNTDDFQNIIIEGEISNDIDVMISTTVLAEGVSITKHKKEIDVIIIGIFHPAHLEQYANRFRNATKINLYVLNKISEEKTQRWFFKESVKKQLMDSAKTQYSLVNNNIEIYGEANIKQIIKMSNDIEGNIIYLNKNEVEIDFLGMSHMLHNDEMFYLNSNFTEYAKYMTKYGWNFTAEITEENKLDKSTKDSIKSHTEICKNQKEELINSILMKIAEENQTMNEYKLENCKDKIEKALRYKINFLTKIIGSFEESFNILNSIGHSDNAWRELRKKYSYQKLKSDNTFMILDTPYVKFLKALYNEFTIGQSYTSLEINEKVNELISTIFNKKNNWSQKRTNLFLNRFFKIENYRKLNSEKQKISYNKILSDNPLDFNILFSSSNNEEIGILIADMIEEN